MNVSEVKEESKDFKEFLVSKEFKAFKVSKV
jgi:hypothetical protein